jgi:hypothetical protein
MMTMAECLEQAERDYPNGYSDYITKYPTDTVAQWEDVLQNIYGGEIKVNDMFIIKSFIDMPNWDKNKLWVFLAHVEYNSNK